MIVKDRFWVNVMGKEAFLEVMNKTKRPENVEVLQALSLQEAIWWQLLWLWHVRGCDKWECLTHVNLMLIWIQLVRAIEELGKHDQQAP